VEGQTQFMLDYHKLIQDEGFHLIGDMANHLKTPQQQKNHVLKNTP
jgi:hypothetical protein